MWKRTFHIAVVFLVRCNTLSWLLKTAVFSAQYTLAGTAVLHQTQLCNR